MPPTAAEPPNRAERTPSADMSDAEFCTSLARLVAEAPPQTLRDHTFFFLPASTPPWFDTGIDLAAGEQVTVFAAGRTYLSHDLDIWLRPSFQLWYRIGASGRIFRGARCSHTFYSAAGGRLFLAGYLPGEWGSPTGDLAVPPEVYSAADGGISVAVLRWTGDALTGLRYLSRCEDATGFVRAELERFQRRIATPDGWHYPLALEMNTDIYSVVVRDGAPPAIACHVHEDAAIIQKDVSLPFTPGTRLRWAWKIDALPSTAREDELQTHDYLSIAVEFDDGQDLTYFWSAALPVDTGFRCPIPTWYGRETHVVVRTGTERLKEWIEEERDLHADYRRFVGAPPARIVRVWLIAVSLFRRRKGACEYGSIELINEDGVTVVN